MNAVQVAVNRYSRCGFSLIPCGPDKRSLVGWAEYQRHRPLKAELQEWFGGTDPPAIGVICGPASGGLTVMDLDDLDVAQAIACDLDLQRQTTLVETPSGGCHVWLRQIEGCCRCHTLKDRDGQPIGDLKGEGGYVVVPPSPGYRFISKVPPAKVLDAFEWAAATLKGVGVDVHRNGDRPAEPLPTRIPEGSRDRLLTSLAGSMRRRGATESAIFAALLTQNAACDPPLPQDQLRKIARSVGRYPPVDLGVAAYREPHPGQQGALHPVTLAQLRARHTGEVAWIVPGYLARGELAFLAGAGESLKSWQAAHLAAAIDGRFKWLGVFDVEAERVLYLELERAGNLVYQLNRIETAERVTLGSERLLILPPTPLPLSEPDAQASLEDVIAVFRPDIVILNALRDALGRANENSPTDIAGLLRPLGQLAERYALSFLILDHFNKSGMHGALRGTAAHAGTAQKYNEADAVMIAERPRNELGKGEGPATVSVTKRRQGMEGSAFAVSVTDTEDGGVLVRAEVGVVALSPLAQVIKGALSEGKGTVEELTKRTGRGKDAVRDGLRDLRAAGLLASEGPPGKPHTYWLT